MRPGRLPEDHPLEQAARDRLRQPSPEAQAKRTEQQSDQAQHMDRDLRNWGKAKPRRWT